MYSCMQTHKHTHTILLAITLCWYHKCQVSRCYYQISSSSRHTTLYGNNCWTTSTCKHIRTYAHTQTHIYHIYTWTHKHHHNYSSLTYFSLLQLSKPGCSTFIFIDITITIHVNNFCFCQSLLKSWCSSHMVMNLTFTVSGNTHRYIVFWYVYLMHNWTSTDWQYGK